jgi:hypothetical protein
MGTVYSGPRNTEKSGTSAFSSAPWALSIQSSRRAPDLREFRVKTYIEIKEETNYTIFVLGWPISISEASVWIAATLINTSFSA